MSNKSKSRSYLALLLLVSCGDRAYDNPVDPGTKENEGTPAADKPASEGTPTGGAACLGEGCTASVSSYLSLNSVKFIGDSCSVADVRVLKNESLNRITLIYRANYQSEGLWQLYSRNVNVAADGTLSLVGTAPTNLFPNRCVGNTQGVSGYLVSGYRSGSNTPKVFNYANASNVTDFSVDMTCYSGALSQSNTFVASTLSPGVDSVTTFFEKDDAIGYFKSKNLYVKSNGSTLNPDGSASSFAIPGNFSSSGSNQLGKIKAIYGNDAAGGMYFAAENGYVKYISSTGAVSDLAYPNTISSNAKTWPSVLSAGGIYHTLFGMFVFDSSYMHGFNLAKKISTSTDSLYYSSALVASKADKALFMDDNRILYEFNFRNGKFVQKSAVVDDGYTSSAVGFGTYEKKALLFGGKCSIFLTSDYF